MAFPSYKLLGDGINYKVLKTNTGLYLIEYKLPQTGEIVSIPASSEAGYKSIIERLKNPQFVDFLYRNKALLAKNKKKPSPAERKAGAKKNAIVLKKYLHSEGENRVKDWSKYALSKKQIPLVTNKKDYAIGMGFGPLEEKGKEYYTSLVIPVPSDGGMKPMWGEIGVIDFLNTAAEFGAKEYKSVTSKLKEHSKAWGELLKHVKLKEKSEARIKDESLTNELYRENPKVAA